MNKHLIILPALLVSATALLVFSLSLEEDVPLNDSQVVTTPSGVVTPPSDTPASTPPSNATSQPSPSAKPTPKATPKPSPTASALPGFGIAATTPDEVLREAQIYAGRVDPFSAITPPDLPEYNPAIAPPQLAFVPPPLEQQTDINTVVVYSTPTPSPPPPEPLLTEGVELKGIINGGLDPVAIIEVNGSSDLYRVGETLPGNVTVTSIHYENKSVTLSRGRQKARLVLEEE